MAHRVPFWLFGVFAGIPADRADRKLVSTTAHYARFFYHSLYSDCIFNALQPWLLILLIFFNSVAWTRG